MWASAAHGADLHGVATNACSPDPGAGMVAWSPGGAGQGVGCATAEVASGPVVGTVVDASGSYEVRPLDEVVGLHLSGGYGFGGVGLGADVPVWLQSLDVNGENNGVLLGDIRVFAPLPVVRPKKSGRVAADLIGEVVLPTGRQEAYLGAGTGAGVHLAVGARGDHASASADLAGGFNSGDTFGGLDTRLWTRLALSGTWLPLRWLGLGAEGWAQVSPLAGADFLAASPAEVLGRVGVGVGPVSITLAGGSAVSPGVGGAEARGYLRVAVGSAPRPAAPRVVETVPAPTPVIPAPDARFTVRDSEDRTIGAATVLIDGQPWGASGPDGSIALTGLSPGPHLVQILHPDFRPLPPIPITLPLADTAPQTVVLSRPPGSVVVLARGPHGPVLDARVRFAGPEFVGPADLGLDGERTFQLLPGEWTVVVSASELGMQEREVHVEAGSTQLVVVDVSLLEDEHGPASLVVRVVDPEGAPVSDAEVALDGRSVGKTGNAGALRLDSLHVGARTIGVSAGRMRDVAPLSVSLLGGVREVEVPMAWKPGQVHVIARGVEGAVVDARVRMTGAGQVPPTNLGPDGEAWFSLAIGSWLAAIASQTYGLQTREFTISERDVLPVELRVALLSEGGSGRLAVLATDSEHRPVEHARVTLDGKDAGQTTGGGLSLEGLDESRHAVVVSAPGYQPWSGSGTVGETVHATLALAGRPVRIRASTASDPVTDAFVRVYGPQVLPPHRVDAHGEYTVDLAPAAWSFVAVSEKYGIGQRDAEVSAGPGPFPVTVLLSAPDPGRATALVEIVDPAGKPVAGATLHIGAELRTLRANGIAVIENVEPGLFPISVQAPGYVPRSVESVDVPEGMSIRRLRMEWLPRPIQVRVRDEHGVPVSAAVRAIGPGHADEAWTGRADARLSLLPGAWQVVVVADGYGPFHRDILVGAGVDAFRVDVGLVRARVAVTATAVELSDTIRFATGKSDIESGSYAVLDQVAATLLWRPELTHVQVGGHTDDIGTPAFNLDLSQRRAEAVKAWLVSRGVEAARLEAMGYGNTRPIEANTTDAGRAANRRVEFALQRE